MTTENTKNIVIGLDSSTQSTKAIAWSRNGTALAEGRADIPMNSPAKGYVEQSTDDWWHAACNALQQLSAQIELTDVAGIAISNQRETVAFLDHTGQSIHPAIVWLDERASSELPLLSKQVGAEVLHNISGKPVDITPVIYRLSWLKHHNPDVLHTSTQILDVHGFLTWKLTGTASASWTSADPFGIFDINTKEWSPILLDALGLTSSQFARAFKPGTKAGNLTDKASSATGLPKNLPVYVAGGDGQCAGLGVNGVRSGIIYLNLGTAMITGAWSRTPRIGHNWRTMASPTGEGFFLEGCQRAGAFLINWFIDTFAGGRDNPAIFDQLEKQASTIPIGSNGIVVCPYLSGCMDPHWDPSARASFNGLTASHDLGHLYRAILEALTLESARVITSMKAQGLQPSKIIAVGGGANNQLWLQMFADATGLPISISQSLEASALGAGIIAAVGANWYSDFSQAATAMSSESKTIYPNPDTYVQWLALSSRQASAYRAGS